MIEDAEGAGLEPAIQFPGPVFETGAMATMRPFLVRDYYTIKLRMKLTQRPFTILTLCIVIFFLSARHVVHAQSTPTYLIINQVRGSECCGQGGVTELVDQIQLSQSVELPTYFALRYDALIDPRYRDLVVKASTADSITIKPALLIEITPELAEATEVTYHGQLENWYRASQVFTLGYEPDDRTKLLDTLMATYHDVFGTYPELTVGWMLDTDSLNYLRQNYGVQAHQITREQWGVDSYSLYGGPAHHPYLASKNWAFMPDVTASDSVIMLRQTITDPVWNYGDTTSAFTSQPNDYERDGKDLEYFKALVAQTWNEENQPGFMVLGLENSMPTAVQQEYQRQLQWLAAFAREKGARSATITDLRQLYSQPQALVHSGTDLTGQEPHTKAWWITTPQYRLRIVQHNSTLWLSDVRLFDTRLEDPYREKVARNQGYWITPALLDTSLQQQPSGKRWWQWWKPPEVNLGQLLPQRDVNQDNPGVKIADLADDTLLIMEKTADGRSLSYQTASGENEKIYFNPDTFVWESSKKRHQYVQQQFQKLGDNSPLSLDTKEENDQLIVSTQLAHDSWNEYRDEHPNQYFPEVSLVDSPDQEQTIIYPNNRYTITGQTPVRIVFAPKSVDGTPVGLREPALLTSETADVEVIEANAAQYQEPVQFFDVFRSEPGVVQLSVTAGTYQWQSHVYFAPDCRADVKYCLSHPLQAGWYVLAKVNDWVRSR